MSPAYADIVKALASCTFRVGWEFKLIRECDAKRCNEQAEPLTTKQKATLLQLVRKYKHQLDPGIVVLAQSLGPLEYRAAAEARAL